jgi:hypothetical protein
MRHHPDDGTPLKRRSVSTKTTLSCILEDVHLHTRRCEKFKSHIFKEVIHSATTKKCTNLQQRTLLL